MARGAIHKREAKRYLGAAKVAALALAVLAGALWAFDLPGGNRGREGKALEVPTAAPPPAVILRPVALDREASAAAAERFAQVSGHKVEAAPAEKGTEEPVAPPAATGPEWKYFGPIYDGLSVRALVSVKGRQRVMREGQEAEGATLQRIAPDLIVIKDGGGEHEIKRVGSEGSRVSWVRATGPGAPVGTVAGATRPPGSPGGPGAPGVGGPGGGGIARGAGANGDAQSRSLDRLRKGRDRGAAGAPGGALAGAPHAPVGTDGQPLPLTAAGAAAATAKDQSAEGFMEQQEKLLNAYPELTAMEEKLRQSGMSPDEITELMNKEYESRGLTPPGKLTPEQQEIREKMMRSQRDSGSPR